MSSKKWKTEPAIEDQRHTNGKSSNIETFDDILPYVGEAGRYQWFLFLLLLPFSVVYAFLYFGQYFMTLLPEGYWCRVPEFDNTNFTDQQKIALSIPPANLSETASEASIPYSRCLMYLTNYTKVLEDVLLNNRTSANRDWPIGRCTHDHSYDLRQVPYLSIAAEQNWVCDDEYIGSATQSAFFTGSIIGGLVHGYIADHYGRLPALVVCNGIGFFASIATTFCTEFWSFALARFVVGTSFDNCFNIVFIIVIEYVGPKYRTIIANASFGIYFAIAASMLPWIAYWIADWRLLSILSASPLVVAFITPWIVPESARWYIINGRVDKAVEMLKKFERVNRKNVPPEIYEEFKRSSNAMLSKNDKAHNYTVLDLFKRMRQARITLVLIAMWLMIILVFDGHVWNMKLLNTDVFMSFSLASMTELPAAIILALFLDRWGRRIMGFVFMFLCGVFSFVAIFQPKGAPAMTMAIIARLGVNVSANLAFQWAAEMLPTVVRAQGISLIHIIGYSAHIMGPYIIYLTNIHTSLPLATLGVLSIVASLLALTLPETIGQELPESLEEGDVFGKEQSFWWIPCVKATPEKKKKYRRKFGEINMGFSRGSLGRISTNL